MVKAIIGLMGSSVAAGSEKMATPESIASFLAMSKKYGVSEVDTARVYNAGKSEELLGESGEAKKGWKIATKVPGFQPGSLSYDKVKGNLGASLAALQEDKIDLYYFHGPDRETSYEESCRAINEGYQAGKFSRFGVSNISPDEIEEIQTMCEKNSWVKPTVYQGGYSPLARLAEEKLFPTLKKYDMNFYAFSPLAGGYFSRPSQQLREPPKGGRMDQMTVFKSLYVNEESLKLHGELESVCKKNDLSMKDGALRWLMFHSPLGSEDGVILGASSEEQMEQNLKATQAGPLPEEAAKAFGDLWPKFVASGHSVPCHS